MHNMSLHNNNNNNSSIILTFVENIKFSGKNEEEHFSTRLQKLIKSPRPYYAGDFQIIDTLKYVKDINNNTRCIGRTNRRTQFIF